MYVCICLKFRNPHAIARPTSGQPTVNVSDPSRGRYSRVAVEDDAEVAVHSPTHLYSSPTK